MLQQRKQNDDFLGGVIFFIFSQQFKTKEGKKSEKALKEVLFFTHPHFFIFAPTLACIAEHPS